MAGTEQRLLYYFATLSTGRTILWCYLIWYLNVLVRFFDPSPRLWLTSLGISAIVGVALIISTTSGGGDTRKLERWQTFRLFLMPFCVSSFSAMVKGHDFILIFDPDPKGNLLPAAAIALFYRFVLILRRMHDSARNRASVTRSA